MMTDALAVLLRLWVALTWLAMATIAGVLLLMFWPFVRERLGVPRHRRGIAPPARAERRLPLFPAADEWCGCCGRLCEPGALWCVLCLQHVAKDGSIEERTWCATHDGEDCPFSATWGDQRDPGDENDTIRAEGLGIPGSPFIERATPGHMVPFDRLPEAEQRLWADALKRATR